MTDLNRKLQLKMQCNAVSTGIGNGDNPLTGLNFAADSSDPVYGKYTPQGNLNFNVLPEIAEGLEVGRKYLVDIYLAPEQN